MITLNGCRIETKWWGDRQAPALVLLHEGLGCVALWRDFPEKLAAATGCGVFAYSRLGYGSSDPVPLPRPLSYMHDEARDWLGPVLDAAGIRRCILVGHSDGASIAAIYGGTVPDARVAGLMLISPHYFVEDICIEAIEQARQAYETGDLRAKLARYHAHVDVAFRGWNGAWLDPGFRSWNITQQVAGITAPVLQLQGLDDPYGTVAQPRACEAHAAGPVRTVLLKARHAPQIEAAEESLCAITDFVGATMQLHYNADSAL
jgi:pimeloyl-ACP methyl ester carboxylesterase